MLEFEEIQKNKRWVSHAMDVIAPVSRLLLMDALALVAELVTGRNCQSLAAPADHPLPAWVRLLPFSVVVERIST